VSYGKRLKLTAKEKRLAVAKNIGKAQNFGIGFHK
jgi:hypothetical protein